MREGTYLLPWELRYLGFIFICSGLLLGILRFYFGLKPEFLHQKVFALLSLYIEPIYFKVVKNQLLEEIDGLSLLFGLFLTAFTKEKEEEPGNNSFRLKSFFISTYLDFLFLTGSILFTFGIGFIYMMIIHMYLFLLAYNISFRILLKRSVHLKDGKTMIS